jgi:hypothetical protein
MSQTRRLAAILAADVAGYSRLIGADEGGTLERLRAARRDLLDPKIAEHRGRLVKTTGDGLLIEFGSVVDALRCAVDVQREMTGRNTGIPPDGRIEFRIGINMGDAIERSQYQRFTCRLFARSLTSSHTWRRLRVSADLNARSAALPSTTGRRRRMSFAANGRD